MSTTIKPSQPEEDYFAREETLKKKRLAEEVRHRYQDQEREQLREVHWMHCPRCGLELQSISYKGFKIDKCFACGAVVMGIADLEKIGGQEGNVVAAIVSLFK